MCQAAIATFSISQLIALLIALLCLVVSGFISGCEISFFSISSNFDDEVEQSPRRDEINRLTENPDRLLATILIANNMVNVAIVVLSTYALSPLFKDLSAVASFLLQSVLLTFLILLFGEILPKLIANSGPLRWAEKTAPVLAGMVKLCYPISSLLVKSTSFVNHVVRKRGGSVTTDELSQALEITNVEPTSGGKEMLEGILKFGDTTASEIMTPRVDMTDIDITATFPEVMKVIIESGYSRLPVYEGTEDNIKGILYSRDLLPYINQREDESFDWRKLLREPYFVPESRMINDLLEDFRKLKIHLAVVIDEYGGTQGIVTLEDVLEEIVGDIKDEYDDDEETFYKRLPDDTYIFEGKTVLTDFFRVTGLDEDDFAEVTADAETLAGMLLAIKGDFLKKKEPIEYRQCRFLVLELSGRRISSVRVKILDEKGDDTEK